MGDETPGSLQIVGLGGGMTGSVKRRHRDEANQKQRTGSLDNVFNKKLGFSLLLTRKPERYFIKWENELRYGR